MPKKGLLNSKGRPAGSGCVSNKRREEFKKKGMERELKNMKLEDEGASKVDWEEDKRVGNRKVRKLTAGDIAEMLKPKPKDETHAKEVEKPCGKEKVEEVEKKNEKKVGEHKPDPPLDKRGGEGSLDKRDVPPAKVVTKEKPGPPATVATKEKPEPPAKVATKEKPGPPAKVPVKKELGPSTKQIKMEEKQEEAKGMKKIDLSSSSSEMATSSSEVASSSGDEAASLTKGSNKVKVEGGRSKQPEVVPPRRPPPPPVKTWRLKVAPEYRVAIDWYNTIKLPYRPPPPENVDALKKLQAHGYELILMSFCGYKREQEVREEAGSLGISWKDMRFTREKAGPHGKVELCKWLNIGTIIDDEDEVVWEVERMGLPYYAIRTRRQPHNWANETYHNLPAAVDAFLKRPK